MRTFALKGRHETMKKRWYGEIVSDPSRFATKVPREAKTFAFFGTPSQMMTPPLLSSPP